MYQLEIKRKIINILQVQRTSKDYYTNNKKKELYQEKLTKYLKKSYKNKQNSLTSLINYGKIMVFVARAGLFLKPH